LYPVNGEAIDKSQVAPADYPKPVETSVTPVTPDQAAEETTTILCDGCGKGIVIDVDSLPKAVVPINPLVAEGLVPESLASVFAPPVRGQEKKRSSKIVMVARVISGSEMLDKLLKKREAKEKEEAEKEKRRLERLEKKEINDRIKMNKLREREEKKRESERKQREKEARKEEKGQKRQEVQQLRVNETLVTVDVHREMEMDVRVDEMDVRVDEMDVSVDEMDVEVNVSILCSVCELLEPEGDEDIAWYQCEWCDAWVHQACVTVPVATDEDFLCEVCTTTIEE
jgi:hypothetical protein